MSIKQISIPEPCQKPWDEMNFTKNGKYCVNCEKEVVDFTKMSSLELVNWFKNANEKVCGRINPTQLIAFNHKIETRNKKILALPKILIATCLGLLTHSKASANITSIVNSKINFDIHFSPKKYQLDKLYNRTDSLIEIRGIVRASEDGLPIPGVKLRLKNSSEVIYTDAEGKFVIKIPKDVTQVTLLGDYIGYNHIEKDLNLTDRSFEIIMSPHQTYMGAVVIVRKTYANFFLNTGVNLMRFMKKIFR
jgi:hypothetical protein